jgi:alcohol dehydrogenase class IV
MKISKTQNFNHDELLARQDWTFPVPIAYGPGRFSELGKHCIAAGISNPLIVTDRGSKDLPFIKQAQSHLSKEGVTSAVFADISPNPREEEITVGKNAFNSSKHDSVIAIGGGSAMDGGKSICLTARNNIHLWDFEWEKPAPVIHKNQAFPKLLTIPTTAGTGAETESTAMVTDNKKGMKFCICHPDLKPTLALLDPELTVSLPANLTAWTGADAMTHAIEAFLVPGFNPLCDGLALEGLSLIAQFLPLVMREPDNVAARGGMLVGSCLAGIAFSKGLGFVHAISHMVGAEYDTQHGLTNAIVLPVVLRFNLPSQRQKVKRMANVMQITEDTDTAFIAQIEAILDDIEIPKSLAEIDVPMSCADRIAEKAFLDSAASTNPRKANLNEMRQLIETAIIKARH